ncbi:MAG: hypothetical protein DRR42_09185 [Gammaproteobacteria bacterium]|nr:MAG: hypothetical protein DRR42_09185 [Gammaproteobacteria bacterium]
MKALLSMLLALLSVGHGLRVYGSTTDAYVDALQSDAVEQALWLDRGWMNLVHYKPLKLNPFRSQSATYSSFVDDERFFLADDGDTSPRAELLATLRGIFDRGQGDNHPQCRFPARLEWLSEQLNIDLDLLPSVDCPLYKQWRAMVSVGSVVLVFPAYHLNSPSSMFGHTLLRLDPSAEREHSDWLAYGVNFGANIPAGDNSLFYAYKGLTGGYPGQFIVAPYFKKIQEYNRVENRDIWEYPLNLTPSEAERLGTHLWELKDINFAYFFFLENCSYRLLELLEVARPTAELTDDYAVAAIPIDTVRSIDRAGFIREYRYRPSIASQFRFQLSTLPKSLHPLIIELAENSTIVERQEFLVLPENQQYRALQAAYNIVRYRQAKKGRDQASAKHSLVLLTALSTYPLHPPLEVPTPVPPEKSHESKRLTLTRGRENNDNFSEVGFRMAYHSLLDNRYGFLDGAQINIGSLAVRHYDDDTLKLERLDMADIISLTPKDDIFDSLSWRIYGGLERVNTKDERPLATHVTGGAGYAYDLWGSTAYALIDARLEHNREFNKSLELALGGEFGWLYQSQLGAGTIKASGLEFTGSEQRLNLSLGQDIVLSVNHSLRFRAIRRWYHDYTANEFSLSYHYFFR